MKIETDRSGRRLYKFSHSVAQGGYLYAHKCEKRSTITNKEELQNLLQAIARKYQLIDVTTKVYDRIFFLFFQMKPSLAPQRLIDFMLEKTAPYSEWHKNYLWTGVYDLKEGYIREYLRKGGYDYDNG